MEGDPTDGVENPTKDEEETREKQAAFKEEAGPFNLFQSVQDLLSNSTHDTDFAAAEGLVDPFIDCCELTLTNPMGTDLKNLKVSVHEYHKALLKTYKAMTLKNSVKAKAYKAEIDRIIDKWNRVVRLERYAEDAAQQEKLPTSQELQLVQEGYKKHLELLHMRKAIEKTASFHNELISGTFPFEEETRQEYIMAFHLLAFPCKQTRLGRPDSKESTNCSWMKRC